jgi:hypothetical protein
LRLDSLRAQIVLTQKSPSGQLPESRRPEGRRNGKFNKFLNLIFKFFYIFF